MKKFTKITLVGMIILAMILGMTACGGDKKESKEEQKDTTTQAEEKYKEPSSEGDGKLSQDELYKLTKWFLDMDDEYKGKCTYEVVAKYIGVEGEDQGNDDGTHSFIWRLDDTNYDFVSFRPNDEGKWVYSSFNTSGFLFSDIPEDVKVDYPTIEE